MPQFTPVPFAGGSYADETMPFSSQETINYLPVRSERPGARSEWILKRAPGLRPYCGVGDGPIRGMHDAEGRRFVVSGTGFYEVSNAGVATLRGTVPGIRRVSIDHNQITGGNEVIVVNGDAGFVWNTVTQTFVTITDAAYPGATTVRYMGQYLCQIEPFRRFWFHSDLAAATQYLSTDRYEAESAPDLLQCLEVNQGELLAFGGRTTEVWRNIADGNSAFSRATVIERGAASPHSTCVLDQTVLFLGDDGIFYRLQGYTPIRISTHPLEQVFAQYDLSRAFCFTWEEVGHKVVYLSFQNGPTFGFDVATQEWHQRKTYGLDRWRVNDTVRWGQRWYAGDYTNGNIYLIDRSYGFDGCEPMERIRTFAVLHANGNRVGVDAVRIEVDTGGAASDGSQPIVISGSLPGGYVGDTVDFTYTVATAYPGQAYELTATGLPTGLTMDTNGHVTGTLEEAGEFDVVIVGEADCGASDRQHEVTVEVTPFDFLALTKPAPGADRIYIGTTADTWQDTVSSAGGEFVRVWDGRVLVFRVAGLLISDDYLATAPTSVSVPWTGISGKRAPIRTSSGRIYVAGSADQKIHWSDDNGDTWDSSADLGFSVEFINGDDNELVAASDTHYRVSTTGPSGFGASTLAPGSLIVSLSYSDGMFLIGTGAGLRWSEDALSTMTAVTLPAPGGDGMECYNFFRTSTGAWLGFNRVNTPGTTDELIARSPDGKAPFVYVTNPLAYQESSIYDGFAERNGVIVAPVLVASPIDMAFLKSETDGTTWTRVDQSFSGFTVDKAWSIAPIEFAT